jgi:hypothetical protein
MSEVHEPLAAALLRAEARIAALEERLNRRAPDHVEEIPTRRGLFKLAGAAVAGVAAHAVLNPTASDAANNDAILVGGSFTGTNETVLTRTGATAGAAWKAEASGSSGIVDGLRGVADGNSSAAGVFGTASSGTGVYGASASGYSLYAGGVARIGLGAHTTSGAVSSPSSQYATGDIVRNSSGDMYVCVAGGTGNAAQFRKIAGVGTSGQLHLLPAPVRVYDSRPVNPAIPAANGAGPISGGVSRTVSLASGLVASTPTSAVPTGARGVMIGLVITSTVGGGRLGVHASTIAWPRNSSTNWYTSGQTVNVTTVSELAGVAALGVSCEGGSTEFIIDVLGYFA